MKRTLSVFVVVALVATPVFAAPVEKLKGGLTSVITSPMEIKDNAMTEVKGEGFLPFALVGGTLKGMFYMGKKMTTGLIDTVTFPLDLKK